MADKEAFFIVVSINKPAGDALRSIAADFAGVWMKHVHPIDLDLNLVVLSIQNIDVWLTKDDKQVALARVLKVVSHVEVGVHPCLKNRNTAQLVEFRGVRVVTEGAGDEHIKVGVTRFPRGRNQIRPGNSSKFWPNENGSTFSAPVSLPPSKYLPSAQIRSPGQGE